MKRDLFRELIVSSFFSLIILYFLPCPTKLFLQNSCEKSNNKMKESINIGIILKGVGRGSTKSFKLLRQFVTLYRSILKHSKEDQPLNFVFITGMNILTYTSILSSLNFTFQRYASGSKFAIYLLLSSTCFTQCLILSILKSL